MLDFKLATRKKHILGAEARFGLCCIKIHPRALAVGSWINPEN